MEDNIQSGHGDGWFGTIFNASEVICNKQDEVRKSVNHRRRASLKNRGLVYGMDKERFAP